MWTDENIVIIGVVTSVFALIQVHSTSYIIIIIIVVVIVNVVVSALSTAVRPTAHCTLQSFAKSRSRMTVLDVRRNLVPDTWTADGEGALPSVSS